MLHGSRSENATFWTAAVDAADAVHEINATAAAGSTSIHLMQKSQPLQKTSSARKHTYKCIVWITSKKK